MFAGFLRDISRRRELERQLGLRLEQQAAVAALGERALRMPLAALVDDAVALARENLALDKCHVWELLESDRLLLRAGSGWEPALVRLLTVPLDPGTLPGYTLDAGRAVIVDDFAADAPCRPADIAGVDVRSTLSVPVPGPDRRFGVIVGCMREPRRFAALRGLDVDFAQGYLLGRPAPADRITPAPGRIPALPA